MVQAVVLIWLGASQRRWLSRVGDELVEGGVYESRKTRMGVWLGGCGEVRDAEMGLDGES